MARQEMLDEEHRLFLDLPPMQELLDGEHQYIDIDLLRGTMTPLDGVEDFDLTADHHLYLVAPAGINFPEVKFTESGQLAKICERVDPEEEEESMDLRFWDVSFVEGERKKLVKEGPFLTREIMAFFKVSREKGSGKVGFEIVPHVETANPPVDEVNSDLQSVAAEQESEEGATCGSI